MNKKPEILYLKVADDIRQKVFSGTMINKNFRLPPERMMSSDMGVSAITVRQAMKLLSQEGIISARRGSGGTYVSQEIIDGQKTVAVLFGLMNDAMVKSPYHLALYRKICRQLKKAGWHVRAYTLFHGSDERDERMMDQVISDARTRKFSGLISMTEVHFLRPGFLELLNELEIRQINFDSHSPVNSILLDYLSMGNMGVHSLYGQGSRRVGLIGDKILGAGLDAEDTVGFLRGVQGRPEMQTREEWIARGIPSVGYGYESFKKIWSSPEKPEGIMVSDEISFLGVIMGMLELRVRYPEDLKLVIQGTKEAKNSCVFSPPRVVFSVDYVSSLAVDQMIRMVREKIASIPVIRVSPALEIEIKPMGVCEPGKKINSESEMARC